MSWVSEAACRAACERGEADPSDWFAERGDWQAVRRARAICASCPVQAECLEAGLNQTFGIWAGTTERERRELRKHAKRCDRCGRLLGVVPQQRRYCEPCRMLLRRETRQASNRRRLDVTRERAS